MIHAEGERFAQRGRPSPFRSFFCEESAAINLAVFRLAVFGWLLHVLLNYHRSFPELVSIPVELRVSPPGYGSLLPLIPIDMPRVIAARRVALVFGSLAFVGLFTRTSAFITSFCLLYLLGIEDLFGKIYHQYHHLVWFAFLLSAAPSGDALSFDAIWASRQRVDRGEAASPASSVAYALPLRFVWLLIGVIYFFPGLAKLRAGSEWMLSDNLKYLMYSYWSRKHFVPWFRIDHYPLLYHSAAIATIVFETSFIACVFSRRFRLLAVAGGIIFHWMTAKYLGLVFWSLVVCYTAFVDWELVFQRLGRWLPGGRRSPSERLGDTVAVHKPSTPSMSPRRASPAVVVVGGTLLIANIYCGVMNIDSWPFCIYPQFGEIVRGSTRRSLEVVARRANGNLQQIKIGIPEGTENRFLQTADAAERAGILGGIRTLIRKRRKLAPGDSILVFEVERSVLPEERHNEPQRRELLLEVRAEG